MADRTDQVFIDDRYVYIGSLGSGGMARVLSAHDTVLGRRVAIKILHEHYAEDPEFVERFRNEAQNAAALSHPNIVSIYDLGRSAEGIYYIAMEHVEGGTLKERLEQEGRLAGGEAAALGAEVADALEAAHRRGVIHRDIKPQNVLLTETGEVRVADFGIARAASETSSGAAASGTGLVLGTASYMSPEQSAGETLGPGSDLYSLGVTLYEALTGRLPFEADGPVAMAFKQVYEEPVTPSETEPSVPEELDALVMKLLAKNPAERYESAGEVSAELRRVRDGEVPAVMADPGATGATAGGTGATAPVSGGPAAAQGSTTARLPTAGGVPRRRQRFPFALLGVAATVVLVAVALTFGVGELLRPGGQQGGGGVDVPDVVGLRLPEARQDLVEAGLEIGAIRESGSSNAPRGEIVSQRPASGATAQTGDPVGVTVSLGGDLPGDPGNGAPGSGSDRSDGSDGSGENGGGGPGGGGGSDGSGAPRGAADQYSGSGG